MVAQWSYDLRLAARDLGSNPGLGKQRSRDYPIAPQPSLSKHYTVTSENAQNEDLACAALIELSWTGVTISGPQAICPT